MLGGSIHLACSSGFGGGDSLDQCGRLQMVLEFFNFLLSSGSSFVYSTAGRWFVMKAFMGAVELRGLGVKSLGVCVHDRFNDMNKLAFNFSIPLLMIVTLIVIVILTEKCPCSLPFEQVNTFRAILFVLVLAYSDITRITLDILNTWNRH